MFSTHTPKSPVAAPLPSTIIKYVLPGVRLLTMSNVFSKPIPVLMSSLHANSVRAPHVPLNTAVWVFVSVLAKLVEICTEGPVGTKLNHTVLLRVPGAQQGGRGSVPTVVAPTLEY